MRCQRLRYCVRSTSCVLWLIVGCGDSSQHSKRDAKIESKTKATCAISKDEIGDFQEGPLALIKKIVSIDRSYEQQNINESLESWLACYENFN
jgi:hypothetical protein